MKTQNPFVHRTLYIVLLSFLLPLSLSAGVTTYTFTSKTWASTNGATPCDGTTDGWVNDKEASDYAKGRIYADGSLNSQGVKIEKNSSGAGATSVQTFDDVRRVTFNLCLNSSKGQGVIHVQVGSNEAQTIVINRPASGEGTLNRDSSIIFTTPQTGKIKFWVDCTDNSIYINSVSIRSASGGSSVFTTDSYQLVTDIAQIQDSDQVIFGVHKDGVNYIMGYYDEWESVNNIHAISGKYAADRSTVNPDDRAIYTLRIAELDGKTAYVFMDELRYEEAYLVASGGKTKNRLALWTDVVDEKTYGNYGFWDIQIENGGEAVITNLGNSLAKIIQYNASNSPTLFACYQDRSQTPVCLYRRTEAVGDIEAIVAPFVNFGTTIEPAGKRTITVNANKLTEDITATLKHGDVFSLSAASIDRDGDNLTISYDAPEVGHYVDTLILRSGSVETAVAVILHRINPMAVNEAVKQQDHTIVFLKDVVVTKKYDNYIYVRDETGSMLLFDRGNGETGKRYGANLKTGDMLSGVTGRFINYFGVPEISPSEQFKTGKNVKVLPEEAPSVIDSADVCRYLVLDSAVVTGSTLTCKTREYAVANKFNLPSFITDVPTRTTVIVSYDRDVVTLYIVAQETYPAPEDPDKPDDPTPDDPKPDDQAIDNTFPSGEGRSKTPGLIMHNGVVFVQTENGLYTLQGEKVL